MDRDTVCCLTTTGRRTGRPHRIEIWFLEYDDAVHLFSGGGGPVTGSATSAGIRPFSSSSPAAYRAEVLDDPDDDVRRRMDHRYHGTGREGRLTGWARRSTVVRLTPEAP